MQNKQVLVADEPIEIDLLIQILNGFKEKGEKFVGFMFYDCDAGYYADRQMGNEIHIVNEVDFFNQE